MSRDLYEKERVEFVALNDNTDRIDALSFSQQAALTQFYSNPLQDYIEKCPMQWKVDIKTHPWFGCDPAKGKDESKMICIIPRGFGKNTYQQMLREDLQLQHIMHDAWEAPKGMKWASQDFINKLTNQLNEINQGETQMKDPIFNTPEKIIGKLIYGIVEGKKYTVYCIGRVLRILAICRLERTAKGFKEIKEVSSVHFKQTSNPYGLEPSAFNISWFLSKAEAELYAKDLNLQEDDD